VELYRFEFHAFGSPCGVQVYASDVEHAGELASVVRTECERIERKFSRYDPLSVISLLNRSSGGEWVEVDQESEALLRFALDVFEKSDGLFDITSGVLRRVWNFRSNRLPHEEDIRALLPLINAREVHVEPGRARLAIPGMEIDFGGFGKEYAVDRCAALLKELGCVHALINFGGDLFALGPHVNGGGWKVGISHPRRKNRVAHTVSLISGALATSGDYERFMVVNGVRYCHLFSPKTGWPVPEFGSVTVVAETCLVAGIEATTAALGTKPGGGPSRTLISPEGTVSTEG
jgi:thiamine biosynthesis lipoprotein